jgi:hypothetical protein
VSRPAPRTVRTPRAGDLSPKTTATRIGRGVDSSRFHFKQPVFTQRKHPGDARGRTVRYSYDLRRLARVLLLCVDWEGRPDANDKPPICLSGQLRSGIMRTPLELPRRMHSLDAGRPPGGSGQCLKKRWGNGYFRVRNGLSWRLAAPRRLTQLRCVCQDPAGLGRGRFRGSWNCHEVAKMARAYAVTVPMSPAFAAARSISAPPRQTARQPAAK